MGYYQLDWSNHGYVTHSFLSSYLSFYSSFSDKNCIVCSPIVDIHSGTGRLSSFNNSRKLPRNNVDTHFFRAQFRFLSLSVFLIFCASTLELALLSVDQRRIEADDSWEKERVNEKARSRRLPKNHGYKDVDHDRITDGNIQYCHVRIIMLCQHDLHFHPVHT